MSGDEGGSLGLIHLAIIGWRNAMFPDCDFPSTIGLTRHKIIISLSYSAYRLKADQDMEKAYSSSWKV